MLTRYVLRKVMLWPLTMLRIVRQRAENSHATRCEFSQLAGKVPRPRVPFLIIGISCHRDLTSQIIIISSNGARELRRVLTMSNGSVALSLTGMPYNIHLVNLALNCTSQKYSSRRFAVRFTSISLHFANLSRLHIETHIKRISLRGIWNS